jgi:creatinine amidohydrolase
LIYVLEDLLGSLHTHGFRRVLVINGHGGNTAALSSAWQAVNPQLSGLRIKTFEWWTDAESYAVVVETMGPQKGSHASLGETAFMLAVRPQAVHLEHLTGRDAPVQPGRELVSREMFQVRYPDSIMGLDPQRATRAAGQALFAKCVDICARELENWDR